MTSTIHESMHDDHRKWEREVSFWRDEIAIWQKELTETEKDFATIKEALEKRAARYRQHAAGIRMFEQDADAHEHALAVFEMGRDGNDLLVFAKQHDSEHGHECERRRVHDKLKHDHRALMAKWKSFVTSVVHQLDSKA